MNKIEFLQLIANDRKEVFIEVATQTGMTPFAVEKDWWVSRCLEIIFQLDVAKHLVFKGGTSLSKAWKLIDRFSEDVDLAIDQDFLMSPTNNWSKKKKTTLRKLAGVYATQNFFPEIEKAFKAQGYQNLVFDIVKTNESDKDPSVLKIFYPNLVNSTGDYMEPCIQIELSCRSLREPFEVKEMNSLVDEYFSEQEFAMPTFMVPTVIPERTFLEKLFLLHEEFHRPEEKRRLDRLSRHVYDIYQLSKSGLSEKSLNDKGLYQTIVAHRYLFSKIGGVDYNTHNPKTLDPIPPKSLKKVWEVDYSKMVESMIYEKNPPTFKQLIENLENLKEQLQNVQWEFDLVFEI
jgi:hypothetical protein